MRTCAVVSCQQSFDLPAVSSSGGAATNSSAAGSSLALGEPRTGVEGESRKVQVVCSLKLSRWWGRIIEAWGFEISKQICHEMGQMFFIQQ